MGDSDNNEVKKLPDLDISRKRFLLSLDWYPKEKKAELQKELVDKVKSQNMVKYYLSLCDHFKWEVDRAWVEETTKANEAKEKELNDKMEDAVKNYGETEVREAHLNKAEWLCSIGDKEAAETAFRLTAEKTLGSGQRLDIIFSLIRMGFFYDDKDLIKRNIEKAKVMVDEGADWDRRNRLKVYEAYYQLSLRQFTKGANLFLDTIATFSSEELFSYEKNVFYTVVSTMFSLDRVALKEKVVDSPEVLSVINETPHLQDYLTSFYESDYRTFFLSLAHISDMMKEDEALYEHVTYYTREMRVRAYKQYLQSYRSVQLKSMAAVFGVTVDFIDRELSRFIALGSLDCKIDAVGGVVETIRPDTKNASYHSMIKQGDLLLNRVQKLSRVINL